MRKRAEQSGTLADGLEQLCGGAVVLFEIERFGETDRKLDALSRIERRGIDHAQRLACSREILRIS